MSRHNDLMVAILTEIFGEEPKEEPKKSKEGEVPPTKTEGFESLVSDKEYEAIVKVKEALENYIDIHNENVLSKPTEVVNSSIYARIQYSVLSMAVDEAQESIAKIWGIHAFNKEAIDNTAKDLEISLEELERKLMMTTLLNKLS